MMVEVARNWSFLRGTSKEKLRGHGENYPRFFSSSCNTARWDQEVRLGY